MKYKILGNTGLRVSELCLGTMTFGTAWGWGANKEMARSMFQKFSDAGGNFIDTADYYTNGESEDWIGEFIYGRRHDHIIATKFSLNTHPDDPNRGGNHRKNIKTSVESSLKNLKTDYIDLYWLHAWDYLSDVEGVVKSLDELVQSGKILYYGFSDTPAWIVSKAATLCQWRGWNTSSAIQVEYNLVERSIERELLPMAAHFNQSVLAWSPLAGGLLSGKYNRSAEGENRLKDDNPRLSDANLAVAQKVVDIAGACGVHPVEVALAWVRQQSSNIIPIIGARNEVQLQTALDSVKLDLTADQLAELRACTDFKLGFPHDFLQSEGVQNIIFGKHIDRIEK